MYSKFITVALAFACAFAPIGAGSVRRDNYRPHMARDPPPSTPAQVSCNSYQPWQANYGYQGGSSVIFNSQLWTSKQYSYNNNPESSAAEWTQVGCCIEPITNKAECASIPSWYQGTAYAKGVKVIYNGRLWIAAQWTQNNRPGDSSGTWQGLGECKP
ncbi:hypothetical protein EDD22DRAFT_163915 [Suillus occidentalis]|nr:hypothetical protein EDD22DRAFT_163915 [Suillus occidentalis]